MWRLAEASGIRLKLTEREKRTEAGSIGGVRVEDSDPRQSDG